LRPGTSIECLNKGLGLRLGSRIQLPVSTNKELPGHDDSRESNTQRSSKATRQILLNKKEKEKEKEEEEEEEEEEQRGGKSTPSLTFSSSSLSDVCEDCACAWQWLWGSQ